MLINNDKEILIEMYERAEEDQKTKVYVDGRLIDSYKSNEFVKVWYDGNKFYCDSADDFLEQVDRYAKFKNRVASMKTYADYINKGDY